MPFCAGIPVLGIALLLLPTLPTAEEVVLRFQEKLGKLVYLRARFIQSFHSETLGSTPSETGILYVKFPDRMRWEYTKPKGKVAVLDGEKTYLYLPEDGQVIVGKWADLLQESPAALLMVGKLEVRKKFMVERVTEYADLPRGVDRIRLIPREPQARFDSILLDLDRQGTRLRRIEMEDPLGNRVEYRFLNIRENQILADELFRFEPPDGVEVQWLEEKAQDGGRGR